MEKTFVKRKKILEKGLERVVKKIVQGYSPQKIILFGSLANGKIYEASDIDLIVIKSTNKNPWERAEEIDKVIDHKIPVDILVYTPEEIAQRLLMKDYFVKEFSEQGKVVYNG